MPKQGNKKQECLNHFCQLSEYCVFGATLDAMLHNRIICGIYDDRILRRLVFEIDLTFETSLEIAKGMESFRINLHLYCMIIQGYCDI